MKRIIQWTLTTFLFSTLFFACIKPSGNSPQKLPVELPSSGLSTIDTVFDITDNKPNADLEKDRLFLWYWGVFSDFSPTGLYLKKGSSLKIFVKSELGIHLPTLLIGTMHADIRRPISRSLQLVNGENTISDTLGGLLYLQYNLPTPQSSPSRCIVSFQTGFEKTPIYILGKTNHLQWLQMLSTYSNAPFATLVGNRIFLVVEKSKADLEKNQDQDKMLTLADKAMEIQDKFSGLDGSAPEHFPNKHKMLITESNVSGNPTSQNRAIMFPTGSSITGLLRVNTSPNGTEFWGGWGPWHELGHKHQVAWNWTGINEVAVNVFTLAVHRLYFPNTPHLAGAWEETRTYLALPDEQKDFNGDYGISPSNRLPMFQQLYLAFGEEFYPKLFKTGRIEHPSFTNNDQRIKYFMLLACRSSGKNLTKFFKKWGLILSTASLNQQVKSEMAALGLPEPIVDPTTLTDLYNFNDVVNLALNKPATQSSTVLNAGASRAVDGNTNPNFSNGSLTHTDNQDPNPAWWQVDLGKSTDIMFINIFNRWDCCRERLKDYKLIVSETPFGSTNQIPTGAQVYQQNSIAENPTTITIQKKGRYVRIQLDNPGAFSLAEVQVMGSPK